MQSYGSGKKGPVCKEDNYVTFRDRNVGQIFGEQLGKTPEFRKNDVLRGANFSKGKNVSAARTTYKRGRHRNKTGK